MRYRSLFIAGGLMVALVLPAGPARAAPEAVTCGATLTRNALLAADLTCAAGDGLTLTSGANLNLGGHRYAGAITVPPAETGAVIRNGTVAGGVDVGEYGTWGTTATVRDVRFDRGGIFVSFGDVTVERSTFDDASLVSFYGDFSADRSTFDGGSVGATGGRATLTRITVRNTDTAVGCSESICSITDSRIENASQYGYDGWDSLATITGTDFTGNAVAYHSRDSVFDAEPPGDLIEGNRFTGNGTGVHFGWGGSATVRGNRFVGNDRGIDTNPLGEELGPRTFYGAIEDNTLTRNGDAIHLPDDFLPTPTGFTLTGNTARQNTGWGIYAPNATDGGANVARGNGRTPQCVGVAC